MLVVADGDMALAQDTAGRLGRAFFDLRHQLVSNYPDLQGGLDRARAATSGPVVLGTCPITPGLAPQQCGLCPAGTELRA